MTFEVEFTFDDDGEWETYDDEDWDSEEDVEFDYNSAEYEEDADYWGNGTVIEIEYGSSGSEAAGFAEGDRVEVCYEGEWQVGTILCHDHDDHWQVQCDEDPEGCITTSNDIRLSSPRQAESEYDSEEM